MNEAEQFAINKVLKDLERALPMTQSFLREFIDKKILKLDDKSTIVKQKKQYEQVRKFLACIQHVPGAFLVLVEILKKDKTCFYIACQLVDIKKKREDCVADQRQKKQKQKQMKAQGMLSHQISGRLAMVVNGAKLPDIDGLPFTGQIKENGKLIAKLESYKKDIDCEEGPNEHLSLLQLFERKYLRSETKCEELKQESEQLKVELAKERENITLLQQRSREIDTRVQKIKEENLKKQKREKEHWEEMRCKEKMKANKELHESRIRYENLVRSCSCRVPKRAFGAQISLGVEDTSDSSDYVHHHPHDQEKNDGFFLQESCDPDQSPNRSDVDTYGCGFSQPQYHNQQDYIVDRPSSNQSPSGSSDQSTVSNINLQDKGTGEKTTYVIVKNVTHSKCYPGLTTSRFDHHSASMNV